MDVMELTETDRTFFGIICPKLTSIDRKVEKMYDNVGQAAMMFDEKTILMDRLSPFLIDQWTP